MIDFIWKEQHDCVMQELKDAIITSPALIPIDYISSHPVFLVINSSWRAVGWILSQECEDGQRKPSGLTFWLDRMERPQESLFTAQRHAQQLSGYAAERGDKPLDPSRSSYSTSSSHSS